MKKKLIIESNAKDFDKFLRVMRRGEKLHELIDFFKYATIWDIIELYLLCLFLLSIFVIPLVLITLIEYFILYR